MLCCKKKKLILVIYEDEIFVWIFSFSSCLKLFIEIMCFQVLYLEFRLIRLKEQLLRAFIHQKAVFTDYANTKFNSKLSSNVRQDLLLV